MIYNVGRDILRAFGHRVAICCGVVGSSLKMIKYGPTTTNMQPRSQGLSSLPPSVVGRKTLVTAGHVTTCDTNYSTGVESINNFCRSQLAEAKERSSNELHL